MAAGDRPLFVGWRGECGNNDQGYRPAGRRDGGNGLKGPQPERPVHKRGDPGKDLGPGQGAQLHAQLDRPLADHPQLARHRRHRARYSQRLFHRTGARLRPGRARARLFDHPVQFRQRSGKGGGASDLPRQSRRRWHRARRERSDPGRQTAGPASDSADLDGPGNSRPRLPRRAHRYGLRAGRLPVGEPSDRKRTQRASPLSAATPRPRTPRSGERGSSGRIARPGCRSIPI